MRSGVQQSLFFTCFGLITLLDIIQRKAIQANVRCTKFLYSDRFHHLLGLVVHSAISYSFVPTIFIVCSTLRYFLACKS